MPPGHRGEALRATQANYFLIVDTDNPTISLPHNSCPPVYSCLPLAASFPSFSGPPRCTQAECTPDMHFFFFPCCVGKALSVLLTISAYQRRALLKMLPQGTAETGGCERSRVTGCKAKRHLFIPSQQIVNAEFLIIIVIII